MAQTVPFGISAPSVERSRAAAQAATRFLDTYLARSHLRPKF